MSRITRDPLLGAAHVLIALFIVMIVFVMAMLLIGFGAAVSFSYGNVMDQIAEAGGPDSTYWAILAIMVLGEGMLFLALRFALELRGIVRSVDHGDPFAPENADRLSRMGWITVGLFGLSLVVGGIAAWIQTVTKDAGPLDVDVSPGASGILLILVLFILARVFRKGTEMRADLEGTV